MNETLKTLISTAAKKFHVNESTLGPSDDFFEKLKINSIQALNLLSELEMTFSVEIPDYELQGVKTFEELARIIEARK